MIQNVSTCLNKSHIKKKTKTFTVRKIYQAKRLIYSTLKRPSIILYNNYENTTVPQLLTTVHDKQLSRKKLDLTHLKKQCVSLRFRN